ncbi:MAG: TRAP transporter small permease [Deltaproteobacteria bacterium]|nr:TRAP transporter small permease [Deltaproteobacteria bacterium]
MRKGGEKIRKILLIIEWSLSGMFLVLITFSVFLQIFTRYFLHFSLSWPEELARFCFIWGSMLGACIAWERKKLHDIDIVFKYFPEAFKPFVALVSNLFVCVILTVLVYYGAQLTALVHLQISPAMEIRMSYVYSAVPFASGLMLISYILGTIEKVAELPFFKHGGENV